MALRLTPEIEKQIAAFLRAGCFPHVAAESAGVPRELFEEWLERGTRKGNRNKKYRLFHSAVMQAQAQARLIAETRALQEKPMDWLKSGPGRDTPDSPGWTAPARPRPPSDQGPLDLFRHPELQGLYSALLDVLTPFPDARAVVAEAFYAARQRSTQSHSPRRVIEPLVLEVCTPEPPAEPSLPLPPAQGPSDA